MGRRNRQYPADTLLFAWSQESVRDFFAKFGEYLRNGSTRGTKNRRSYGSASKESKRTAHGGST